MGPEISRRKENPVLNELIEEFGISVADTFQVRVDWVDSRVCRLLKLKLPEHNVYLLETPALLRYASHPHICGDSLEKLLSSDSEFIRAIVSQFSLERFGKPLVLGKLVESMGLPHPRVGELGRLGDTVLIASPPELDAESLRRVSEEVSNRAGRLKVLLAMGFLSVEDLRSLDGEAKSLGLDTIYVSFLLLGRRTQGGEMYLYGYDIEALRKGVLKEVGSIVDAETLGKLFQDYPPSTDLSLTRERLSGSLEYLRSSLERTVLLMEHPVFDSWQLENLLREAKALAREIERRGGRYKLP